MTIETKANAGAWIFYMRDNKVKQAQVDEIKISVRDEYFNTTAYISYSLKNVDDRLFNESEIFLSKEDLLKSL